MGGQTSSIPVAQKDVSGTKKDVVLKKELPSIVPESRTVRTKDDQLSNILEFISINDSKKKDYMNYFETVRDLMLRKLRGLSPAFKSLNNGIDLAGSYADGLKVMKPNEFDFHVYLRLSEFNLLDIQKSEGYPGQVDINVKQVLTKIRNMYQYADVHKVLSKLIDSDNFLQPKKIQSWLEGLIVKALQEIGNDFTVGGDKYHLAYGKSGPAHTLYVTVNHSDSFSIDFVPVIKILVSEHWPCEKDPIRLEANNFWVAVAKPKGSGSSFQTSFEFMERQLIKSKYNLKAVDRLLKKLRDRHNLNNLKSYYIKTVCLWKNDEVAGSFWSKSLFFVFSEVFKKIISFCEDYNMPFYWDDEQNMFDKLNYSQKNDIRMKLMKIFKDINNSGAQDLAEIFLEKHELIGFNNKHNFR